MNINPGLEEIKAIAKNGEYSIVPVSAEVYADEITPVSLLKRLKKISRHCFILESAEENKSWGRYTFLGYNPVMCVTCRDGSVKVIEGDTVKEEMSDPNECIKKILSEYKSVKFPHLPPFTGGLVGYFAYDYAKYSLSKLKLDAKNDEHFNDVDLMLFDKVIAFDNFRKKIVLTVNIKINNDDIEKEYEYAVKAVNEMKDIIKNAPVSDEKPIQRFTPEFTSLFNEEQYCDMVNKAKHYIKEGDIFQVVLSNRLDAEYAEYNGSLLDTYRVLRTINPSPYMFYFSGDELEIAGASPETLVKLQDGKLQTFPLAGSRPRGADDKEDLRLSEELLRDEKECSEHNMLVDLARNDLGKISKFGSVSVDKYMEVLRFSHIMHIGSTVTSEIADGKDGLDAINAVLPAGTLSGAPKIRAMEIINELEQCKRGIYGGAIGYLDFTGNMDTCIAIRIAYKKGNRVFVRSGAGIVADSNPELEYKESINKAKAVVNALNKSAEGIE